MSRRLDTQQTLGGTANVSETLSTLFGAFQRTVICGLVLFSAAFCASVALAQQPADADKLNRTVLPIPEPHYPHSTVLDVRNATPPPRFEIKAPAGAPKVLIVLINDMGFGQSSAFGGPIKMPTVDRLASSGLRISSYRCISGWKGHETLSILISSSIEGSNKAAGSEIALPL